MKHTEGASRVHNAEFGHTLTIAVQIGLVDVLRSWNLKPDLVIGHSSGEMGAAYASGAITAEGAIAVATFRGTSNVSSDRKGSMAAIGMGREEISPFLNPGVVIACDNSQLSVTIAGDTDGVLQVIETLKVEKPGVFARLLRVEKAFHSRESSPGDIESIEQNANTEAQIICANMVRDTRTKSSRSYKVSIL